MAKFNVTSMRSKDMKLDDNNIKSAEDIPGLSLALLPNQRTAVQAILDIESQREYRNVINKYGEKVTVTTSACVLADKVSAGKTITTLAILLLRKTPSRAIGENIGYLDENMYNDSRGFKSTNANIYRYGRQHNPIYNTHDNDDDKSNSEEEHGSSGIIRYKRIINCNFIIVNSSVYMEWRKSIENYTTLKLFCVDNLNSLKDFVKIVKENGLEIFDVVLVRCGNITRDIPQNAELSRNLGTDSTFHIISNISMLLNDVSIGWLIYDDFDQMQFPNYYNKINSLFTIYISATTRKHVPQNHALIAGADQLEYINRTKNSMVSSIDKDRNLFDLFCVKCSNDYIDSSFKITIMKFFVHMYVNPDEAIVGFIKSFQNDVANEIMQKMNADAIADVCNSLGINLSSPITIFKKLLGDNYNEYNKEINVIKLIEKTIDYVQSKPEPTDDDKFVEYSQDSIKNIIASIENKKTIPIQMINFYTNFLVERLNNLKDIHNVALNKVSASLDRVKDNIKSGTCVICKLSMKEDSTKICITKCCGVTICDFCFKGGFKVNTTVDAKGNKVITGKCPKCLKHMNLAMDMISIDSSEDIIDKILSDDVPPEEEKIKEEDNVKPKIKAVYDIINRNSNMIKNSTDMPINNIFPGNIDVPRYSKFTKMIVFSNYDESFKVLLDGIPSRPDVVVKLLSGTHNQIYDIVNEYKNAKSDYVLLINARKYCAGLNLQNSTDMVFMHRVLDNNLYTQIIGRGQRFGRIENLHIHMLHYENE